MTGAVTARRIRSRLSFLFVLLLLLLPGCSGLGANAVVIHGSADARLVTRVREGLFLATVRIGDREAAPFLVDTGASSLLLDSEFAKGVPLSFAGEVDSPEIIKKVKLGSLASLEVGPLTLRNTNILVRDLSAPTPALGERLAGILGHPFFSKVVVQIDYLTGSVACFDPKTYRLPRGEWLPLTFQAGRPIIPARLEGNIEGRFMLDTGATAAVVLSAEFVRTHPLLETRHIGKGRQISLSGPYETRVVEIASFEFAGRRFERPQVQIAPPDTPEPKPDGIAGIIGQGFLRHFTIVLNYPAAKIAFLPE